ncbi:hypothetical protein [Haloferax denitrificans]|uniref:hypothetical protein n=1 Tax=Haloferax denitrificans TaxID=35745 RepID=UPI001267AD3D|nr:hypothetical protein [Haloferax denitrificans]
MTGISGFNRREVLAGISGFGLIGLAGCTSGSVTGDVQTDTPSAETETHTEASPQVGKYGLPHCESGNYAFQILEIEKGNSVDYPNFVAKNLTTDRLEIFSVKEDGDEYFVEVTFEPKETKTVVIEGTGFGPTSDFRLDVNGLDEEYDGMKCATGSPSGSGASESTETTQPKPEYESQSSDIARKSSIEFEYYSNTERYDGQEFRTGGKDANDFVVLTMSTPDYLLSENIDAEISGGDECDSSNPTLGKTYWYRGGHEGAKEVKSGDKLFVYSFSWRNSDSECTLSGGKIRVSWTEESDNSILLGEFEIP